MRPPRWSSLVFVLGVVLVFGALGWATFHALRLERLEAEARAQAHYQESIRLALWRMDSRITPIIAREAARPYFQYRPFYPADRAYTRMLSPVENGEVLVPSPLLQATDPYLKLHFERGPDGALRSPQVPMGEMRTIAESVYVTGYAVVSSEQLLAQLDELMSPTSRRKVALATGGAPASEQQDQAIPKPAEPPEDMQTKDQLQSSAPLNQPAYRQQLKQSADEYQNRMANAQVAQQPAPQQAKAPSMPTRSAPAAGEGAPAPIPADAARAEPPPTSAAPASPASKNEPIEKGAARDKVPETRRAYDDQERKPVQDPRRGDSKLQGEYKRTLPTQELAKEQLDQSAHGYLDQSPPSTPLLVGALEAGVLQGQFTPSWVVGPKAGADELVYTREVEAGDARLTQGFWVDWPALRATLLTDARDLLPGATLRPLLAAPDPADDAVLGRTLAALPAVLDAPPPTMAEMPAWSPVRSTLLATWIAALGAMIAIALVLRASMELAERRGRFVSAVTHELRTPLTTFCLYSQMLADGMVPTEEDRRSYAKTLNNESQRLARIVESVLEYARLGRRQGHGKTRAPVTELMDKIIPSLSQRCEQAGMELTVRAEAGGDSHIVADPATLERVLFNLVDNACKYASQGDDKRVHLSIETSGRDLLISVRDHGPGLERQEQKRVFRPFVRGRRQSDGSIPGLGLGLALSQGLARELHGELRTAECADGAEFRLRVPLA